MSEQIDTFRLVPPDPPERTDPRHKLIELGIKQLHSDYNKMRLDLVPWSGAEARALHLLLKQFPSLTVENALICAENRYQSGRNSAEYPRKWLPYLLEYWHGPVDGYGKPIVPKSDEASIGMY